MALLLPPPHNFKAVACEALGECEANPARRSRDDGDLSSLKFQASARFGRDITKDQTMPAVSIRRKSAEDGGNDS